MVYIVMAHIFYGLCSSDRTHVQVWTTLVTAYVGVAKIVMAYIGMATLR